MALPELVLDQWAPLNHKLPMATGQVPSAASLAPTWVDADHRRRLNAYIVLQAYLSNAARWYVNASAEDQERRREYGDPKLVQKQLSAAIIGRGARLNVVGAEKPAVSPKDNEPTPTDATGDPIDQATHKAAVERQRQLDRWADDEGWSLKMLRAEETAVGLGDAVYWLSWSAKKKRARLRVLDPGFYFPVYKPGEGSEDYPEKVHLAWEFSDDSSGREERYVRRITFELVPLTAPRSVAYQDEPTEVACVMTDAVWNMKTLRGTSSDFERSAATFMVNEDGQPIDQLDLGIDFIPVVHLPNTDGDPWGESVLTNISQILDDLQVADTDVFQAADVAGAPPIAINGSESATEMVTYGPGTVWRIPVGGGAEVLDTSKGLSSLLDHRSALFERIATNSRIPEEILGRVSADDVPSGSALVLSFAPFEVLVAQARAIRDPKYRLLLKMVQRLYIHYGEWDGKVLSADMAWGTALPSDLGALADLLVKLTGNTALLSRPSAIQMLASAGLEVEDVAEEVRRVEREDFQGANMLYRATRSPELASEYLGLEEPERALLEALAKFISSEKRLNDVRSILDAAGAALASDNVTDNGMQGNATRNDQGSPQTKTPGGSLPPGTPAPRGPVGSRQPEAGRTSRSANST